jgi:hypothetical protein
VVVSLLLGGALTWLLVRDLVVQNVQEQLDRGVVVVSAQVKHQECLTRPPLVSNPGAVTCKLDTPVEFEDRLNSLVVPTLSGNRLLLLRSDRTVVWDSANKEMFLTVVPLTPSKLITGVAAMRTSARRSRSLRRATRLAPRTSCSPSLKLWL